MLVGDSHELTLCQSRISPRGHASTKASTSKRPSDESVGLLEGNGKRARWDTSGTSEDGRSELSSDIGSPGTLDNGRRHVIDGNTSGPDHPASRESRSDVAMTSDDESTDDGLNENDDHQPSAEELEMHVDASGLDSEGVDDVVESVETDELLESDESHHAPQGMTTSLVLDTSHLVQ